MSSPMSDKQSNDSAQNTEESSLKISPPSPTDLQLQQLRTEIDELDRTLVALIEARVHICRKLGVFKYLSNRPFRDPQREQEVLDTLLALTEDEVVHQMIEELYTTIRRGCLKTQSSVEHLDEPERQAWIERHLSDEREVWMEYASSEDAFDADTLDESAFEEELNPETEDQLLPIVSQPAHPQGWFNLRKRIGFLRKREKPALLSENQRQWLTQIPFAHRGLHDEHQGYAENSLGSFQRAIDHGYGIELDVHLSADGEVMVFHDDTLDRMTNQSGNLGDLSCYELKKLALIPSGETIPTLKEVLNLVQGQVPILVEIKNPAQPVGPLEEAVALLIDQYQGPITVQSFNPFSLKWFVKHRPHIVRGLLSYSYPLEEVQLSASTRFLLRNVLFSPLCKPHYIAYDYQDLGRFKLRHLHRLRAKGCPLLVWTVASEEAYKLAQLRADNLIFEYISPPTPMPIPSSVHKEKPSS